MMTYAYCPLPVAAVSVRTLTATSTSRALAACSTAERAADAAGSTIVPSPPATSKSAAAPVSDHAPPTGAVPHPSATVRAKPSPARRVDATAR